MTAHFHGVVAIDGPSGSGKSSVSRKVAARLGFAYLDTGAMYRAVCLTAMRRGVPLADQQAVAEVARRMRIFVSTDPEVPQVVVDEVDLTTDIRTTEVSEAVSAVSTNLAVRQELVARQRDMIRRGDIVLEGRDTTTVVAPDADVRILVTADAEARLSRRTAELHVVVDDDTLASTRRQIFERDEKDSTVVDFLVAAEGVVTVDTSTLSLDEAVEKVLEVVASRAGAGR